MIALNYHVLLWLKRELFESSSSSLSLPLLLPLSVSSLFILFILVIIAPPILRDGFHDNPDNVANPNPPNPCVCEPPVLDDITGNQQVMHYH